MKAVRVVTVLGGQAAAPGKATGWRDGLAGRC